MIEKISFLFFICIINSQEPAITINNNLLIENVTYDSIINGDNISELLDNEDYLFIESSKNYFHILLREGFLTGPFSKNQFAYRKYSKSIPKEINVELQALSQVRMGSNSYLLYPGGGILFKFSESDNSITRIDRSFAHRNQYSGYFFSHGKDLYLLGGYGFWETKSLLTKFNFSSGEWDYVNTTGQIPEGIDQGNFLIKNDKLYAFGFLKRTSNNQKSFKEKNLYVLSLPKFNDLGEIDKKISFNWEKKGVLNPILNDIPINLSNKSLRLGKNLLLSIADNPNLYLIDPENNSFKTIPNDLLLYKSTGKSLIKNNELARVVKNFSTGKISIAYFNLTGLEKREGIIDEYLYRSTDNFYIFLICGFILLISIIIFLWIFFSLNNRKYVLTNKEIIHSKGSIGLTKEELLFIKYFLKEKIVSNAQVMSLFIEKSKTKDYAIKRKNRITSSLNKRFLILFNTNLFLIEKSKKDSRQMNYILNKNIIIKEG